jgi:glycerol-3-phosphate dehydrogenase
MKITEAEISDFLAEINAAYPGRMIPRDGVTFFHKGFLPMDGVDPKNGEVILSKHTLLIDHQRADGVTGLLSVAGVKYTTARSEARRVIDKVARKLGMRIGPSHSHRTPLVGGNIGPFETFVERTVEKAGPDLSTEAVRRLVVQYGSCVDDILEIAAGHPHKERNLPGTDDVLRAEIEYILREELVVKLSDIVFRRTNLGTVSCPEAETLEAVASIMAGRLNWDSGRKTEEIDAVRSMYVPDQSKRRSE